MERSMLKGRNLANEYWAEVVMWCLCDKQIPNKECDEQSTRRSMSRYIL